MRYSLRQLEVFLAVARTESVSRAAEALSMSQSAASSSLSELERQFDVQLFDRVGKRLQLNELGRSLRPRAAAVTEQAAELERVLAFGSGIGRLRVGATLTIGSHVAVPLVARYLREHPSADVTLEVANTEEIARRVESFEIDVGLVEGELAHPELSVTPFRDDELVVFAPKGHPLTRRRALTDADLIATPWIVREPGSGTRQTFDRAMQGILPDLRLALELQQTDAIRQAVEAGLGLGCLSRLALREAFAQGALAPCRVPHRDLRRKFHVVLHRQKYRSEGVRAFLDVCARGA